MLLIADSGSSKTDWRLVSPEGVVKSAHTAGFNPYFQNADHIYSEIADQLPLQLSTVRVTEVYFYGAGCSTEKIAASFGKGSAGLYPEARIYVSHDLLAAARALSGRKPGIACILGTGVNSCQYDGETITSGRPSLGFWLGDEGGGGYLGKTLIQHYFHEDMPPDIRQEFGQAFHPELPVVLENAYKKPFPNSYFAAFAKFLADKKEHDYCRRLISGGFGLFFDRYVCKYPNAEDYPVHFTGSVAHYYQDILREVAQMKGLQIGNILKNPIEGLISYHK